MCAMCRMECVGWNTMHAMCAMRNDACDACELAIHVMYAMNGLDGMQYILVYCDRQEILDGNACQAAIFFNRRSTCV